MLKHRKALVFGQQHNQHQQIIPRVKVGFKRANAFMFTTKGKKYGGAAKSLILCSIGPNGKPIHQCSFSTQSAIPVTLTAEQFTQHSCVTKQTNVEVLNEKKKKKRNYR